MTQNPCWKSGWRAEWRVQRATGKKVPPGLETGAGCIGIHGSHFWELEPCVEHAWWQRWEAEEIQATGTPTCPDLSPWSPRKGKINGLLKCRSLRSGAGIWPMQSVYWSRGRSVPMSSSLSWEEIRETGPRQSHVLFNENSASPPPPPTPQQRTHRDSKTSARVT